MSSNIRQPEAAEATPSASALDLEGSEVVPGIVEATNGDDDIESKRLSADDEVVTSWSWNPRATVMTTAVISTMKTPWRSKPNETQDLFSKDRVLRQRKWERESRRRRQMRLRTMENKIEALESVASNLPPLLKSTSGTSSNDFPPDEVSHRMQSFLRRSMELKPIRQHLEQENVELRALLRDHFKSTAAITRAMRGLHVEDWSFRVERWKSIVREFFTPWSRERCLDVVRNSLQSIADFQSSTDLVSSGLCIDGWCDQRRFDKISKIIEFAFYKRKQCDAAMPAQRCWEKYFTGDGYQCTFLGPNVRVYHEVLQYIAPDMIIVRISEQYNGSHMIFHQLFLVFRAFVNNNFIVGIRSVIDREVELATDDPDSVWTRNFYWFMFEVVAHRPDGSCREHRMWTCGKLGSSIMLYPRRWVTELLLTLPRMESILYEQDLLRVAG